MKNQILDNLKDLDVQPTPKYWRYVGVLRLIFYSMVVGRMLLDADLTNLFNQLQNSAQTIGSYLAIGLFLLYFFYHFSKGILEIRLQPKYPLKAVQVIAILFTIIYLVVLFYLSSQDFQNWTTSYSFIWLVLISCYVWICIFDIKSLRL